MHFGFTNIGSEMPSFKVIAVKHFKNGSWTPCTMQQFADEYVHFLARFGSDQVGRPTILNYL